MGAQGKRIEILEDMYESPLPSLLLALNFSRGYICRKRKDLPDQGSNPGLPKSSKGAWPFRYPASTSSGIINSNNIVVFAEV